MKVKLLIGAMLITSNTLIAAPFYTIELIGTPESDSYSVKDINDHGQIVGTYTDQHY